MTAETRQSMVSFLLPGVDPGTVAGMSTESTKPSHGPSRRRFLRARRIAAALLATIIVLGLAGQVIRDRSVPLAVLMYFPLLPVGLAAVALDLAQLGRALPRVRFGLTLLGAVASTWAAVTMIGAGVVGEFRSDDPEVTVLHWNVQWGGGLFRSPRTWSAQRSEILEAQSGHRHSHRASSGRLARAARR